MLKSVESLDPFCVTREATVREALQAINRNLCGAVIVVDANRKALAALTDGDLRRAILAGIQLDDAINQVVGLKSASMISVPFGASMAECSRVMLENKIRHLPLLDELGILKDIVTAESLTSPVIENGKAVIMAGGFGRRLHPLTEDMPKPMLPLGDRPIMEHIVDQLRTAGIHRISVSTHYKAEKITNHFGDGEAFGVEIDYLAEECPLGTAGSLGLLPPIDETLLVVNGDVLTSVDFCAMLAFHREHAAALTVGVRQYDFKVPYGVVETDSWRVSGLSEKPEFHFFVNVGIYFLEPEALRHIPKNERCDMTDLIHRLIEVGLPVASFPVVEYWLDIGQHNDYAQARSDMQSGKIETHE